MSVHFGPGEYSVVQGTKEVGRLVAVDSPAVAEYWYLYLDVPTTGGSYATYTAAGPFPTTYPPPAGHYAVATSIEWTFLYLGPAPTGFDPRNPSGYSGVLAARSDFSGRVPPPIIATAVDCSSEEIARIAVPDIEYQLMWGTYNLLDASKSRLVGAVNVPGPASPAYENWVLAPGYVAPAATLPRLTYYIEYVLSLPTVSGTPFCVQCSQVPQ